MFLVHFFWNYFSEYRAIDFDTFNLWQATKSIDLIGFYFFSSHYGVDLFFMLSGFLIFRIIRQEDFCYFRFLWNRLVRLYPAFLCAVLLQLTYAVCAWNKTFSLGTVVSNFLFLHGIWELGIEPIIIPTWSLTYEWLFYLIFPALVLVVRRGNGLSLHHTLLCAGVALLLILPFSGDYVRFLMFFAGASLASLRPRQVQNWATKVSDWPIIILALLVNGLFVFDKNYPHFIWPFLITTSVLVAKAVYGTGLLNRIFSLAPLRSLGNISYSFYLLHGTIIMLLMDQVGPALKGLTPILGFILLISSAFCLSIVSAKFSYVVLEAPYFAWRAQSVKGEDATLVKFHKRTYQDIGFFLRRLP